MFRFSSVTMAAAGLLLQASVAGAFPSLPAAVVAQYPTATNLESCGTCHVSFNGSNVATNPYGAAFGAAFAGDAAAAFVAIEGADSDGDGTSNIDEIDTDAGFFPGWSCETYTNATNPIANLADLVDPVDPGCNGTTSTTTVTSTTVTTSTTSTTLPGEQACSQPVTSGPTPVATDCLFILQAVVGSQTCSPECICAPTGTLPPKATDALLCLKVSVGENIPLQCPCNGGSTTTTTSSTTGEPTTTSTSTTVVGPTTTNTSTTTNTTPG